MTILEPTTLIKTVGYVGLFFVVFAESGLLIGFFLPGDSLLFTAGFLASQGYLSLWVLIPLTFTAAILGDNVGYMFGYRIGPRIFKREDSWLFHKDHLRKAEAFFKEHGPKTIVLARFLPIIRTFAPIVAGVGRMRYSTFLFYNLVGGVIWGIGFPLLGYFLGSIPFVQANFEFFVILIVLVSFLPGVYHVSKEYMRSRRTR